MGHTLTKPYLWATLVDKTSHFRATLLVIPQRVHFKMDIGDDANDYAEVAERERLTELQKEIRRLLDKANKVKKEQDYQRVRPSFSICFCVLILLIKDAVPVSTDKSITCITCKTCILIRTSG